jgi:hypothetical protein
MRGGRLMPVLAQPKMTQARSSQPERNHMSISQTDEPNRSNTMNLMYEELARAHMVARLSRARERSQSAQLRRSRRLARRGEHVTE